MIRFYQLLFRTRDATMAEAWEGLMPRDNPRDTRFAINFFTSIGLGALTEVRIVVQFQVFNENIFSGSEISFEECSQTNCNCDSHGQR